MAEQSGEKRRRISVGRQVAALLEEALEEGGEGGAVDELHDDEVDIALAVEVVHTHDVGVAESGHGARLAAEAADEGGVDGEVAVEDLEGDGAVEAGVTGLVDGGHAAAADQGGDLITAQGAPY